VGALRDAEAEGRIMAKRIKVARIADLAPGSGTTVDVEGQRIALFNVHGTYYAIDDTCPHRGGPLGEGELDGAIVTCPWHGATFDVQTGAVTGPPARNGVRSFPVCVEGEDVLVEIA
jgi:nitrite reductase (NADH) small subunit